MSKVKDPSLAAQGRMKLAWAGRHMPVLAAIRDQFKNAKPFTGLVIGCCLHVTKETGVLVQTLMAGGARVAIAGSNPLSTQDDVAAALAAEGAEVFAWRGVSEQEYYECLRAVIATKPDIVIDDGADLISTIHKNHPNLQLIGAMEETTTGVIRLKAMEKDGKLRFPILAVNNAHTKMLLDNVYGTGQSTIDGILRATNILLAGKTFVIAGYGNCGRGLAKRAEGMGCKVVVTETDPRKAIQALYEGYRVMPMKDAAKAGDIFVTVTGNKDIIRKEHIQLMKDGAILANAGHFNVEINITDLQSLTKQRTVLKDGLDQFLLKDGRSVFLLGEGRLVNLATAEGHPSEVMQTSFANQALCALYLVEHKGKLATAVHDVPLSIDEHVAKLALESYGVKIDALTKEQQAYLSGWQEGT